MAGGRRLQAIASGESTAAVTGKQEIVRVVAACVTTIAVTSISSFAKTWTHGRKAAISGHSRAIDGSRKELDSIFLHYLYSASGLGRCSHSCGLAPFFVPQRTSRPLSFKNTFPQY